MNGSMKTYRATRQADNHGERGTLVILGALTLCVLTAFAGLALDASYMYFHKRKMQTAADAGAYAGALTKLRGSTSIARAVTHDTAKNGFTDGLDNVTVQVNNPPLSGTKTGNSDFVEVIITQPQPTWFMRVVNFNSVNVKARAVAGLGSTSNGCVFALNQDNSQQNNGFFVNGTTDSGFNCGVFSNANFRSVGGACVVAPSVNYTGDYANQNSSGNCGPPGMERGIPIVDPLENKYSIPSYGSCTENNFRVNGGTTITVSPGTYCGGITISGSVQNVVFNPGEYVLLGGGLSVSGSANISGSGVTFFNTYPGTQANKYDSIKLSGSGVMNFSAPTTGTYKGLLFYQDPRVQGTSNNGSIVGGGTNSTFNGIFYFPTTDLEYSGNSSTNANGTDGYTLLIGYNIKINGSARINADFSALGGNPLQNALMVE
jgi:hypothetical protein